MRLRWPQLGSISWTDNPGRYRSEWMKRTRENEDDHSALVSFFKKVYQGDRHVTFQTCIAGPGSLSWGRLFVIATPKPRFTGFDHFDHLIGQ